MRTTCGNIRHPSAQPGNIFAVVNHYLAVQDTLGTKAPSDEGAVSEAD